jgi:hypothetical protein
VFADDEALRRHRDERLNAEIRELSVLEIDYVRETTRVEVRYIPAPRTGSISKEALDATVAGPGR